MTDYPALLELIQTRRSIRRFADRPVGRDDLNRLLEAARWAPSNHNRQPWRFLILQEPTIIRDLAGKIAQDLAVKVKRLPEAATAHAVEFTRHATFFSEAPVVIVALHKRPVALAAALLEGLKNPEMVSGEPLSVAMAVQNLLLAAQTLGLGACVLTGPLLSPAVIRRELALPAGHDVTCFVALGHPAESPAAPRRKELEHIVAGGHDRLAERVP